MTAFARVARDAFNVVRGYSSGRLFPTMRDAVVYYARRTEMMDTAAYYARHTDVLHRLVLSMLNFPLRVRRYWTVSIAYRYRTMRSRRKFYRDRRHLLSVPRRTVSLVCPTRGRARQVCEFIASVRNTAACPERLELLFYVDSDDPQSGLYEKLLKRAQRRHPQLACKLIIGPPMSVSKSWNVLAQAATGDVIGMANDDQIYVDFGWDMALDLAATSYDDEIFCFYFDGGQYPEGAADFPLVSRRWYETLGYFTPGIFAFWNNEHWIFDLARRIGRLQPIPHFFVDHLHFSDLLSPFDATYQQHRLTRERASADMNLYTTSAKLRERGSQALQRAISTTQR